MRRQKKKIRQQNTNSTLLHSDGELQLDEDQRKPAALSPAALRTKNSLAANGSSIDETLPNLKDTTNSFPHSQVLSVARAPSVENAWGGLDASPSPPHDGISSETILPRPDDVLHIINSSLLRNNGEIPGCDLQVIQQMEMVMSTGKCAREVSWIAIGSIKLARNNGLRELSGQYGITKGGIPGKDKFLICETTIEQTRAMVWTLCWLQRRGAMIECPCGLEL